MKQKNNAEKIILFDIAALSQSRFVEEIAMRASNKGIKVVISFSGSNEEARAKVTEIANTHGWTVVNQERDEDGKPESELAPSGITKTGDPIAEGDNTRESGLSRVVKTSSRVTQFVISALSGVFKQRVSINKKFETDRVVQIYVQNLRKQKDAAMRIMKSVKPSILIVCEDGISGNACLIGAAKTCRIPVIVCPYGFCGQEDFDNYVDEKYKEGALITLNNNAIDVAVEEAYPHWIRQTRYGKVIIFPPEYIIARELEGLSLPHPWTAIGGNGDLVAVESSAMMRHYIREGLPERKLALLGSPYSDVIREVLDTNLACGQAYCKGSKMKLGRTSVLIALPPSYHDTRGYASEFPSYEMMCRTFAQEFSQNGHLDCTFVIHPATLPEHQRCVRELKLPVSDEWVIRLIPTHDVYVTSFSSTIRWAIACGKPVVNYDAYKFHLKAFAEVPAVKTTDSFADVSRWIKDLQNDAEYGHLARIASEHKEMWGILDGKNSDRILSHVFAIV